MINQTTIYGSTVTYFLSLMRNNVADVTNPSAIGADSDSRDTTSQWVVSAFPQPKKYKDFPGYPILIVNTPSVSQDSMSHGNVKLDSAIILFTILDKGNTPVNADNIASQVKKIMDTHWVSTRAVGIGMVNLVSSNTASIDSGDDTIMRSLEYNIVYSNMPNYTS